MKNQFLGKLAFLALAITLNTTATQAQTEEEMLELLQGQMGKIDEIKYKCSDMKPDNGTSGATHTKHMGKIVFAKTEIIKSQENEASFTNSFTSADNIYARIYVAKSPANEAKSIGVCFGQNVYLRYTFDDGKTKIAGTERRTENPEDHWTTWQVALSPSAADAKSGYPKPELQNFYTCLEALPDGVHKVKIELVFDIPEDKIDTRNSDNSYMYTTKFGAEKILAAGEFSINVKSADKPAVKKKLSAKSKQELATEEAERRAAFAKSYSSNSSSSSATGGSSVTIRNKGNSTVYIAKYNSESSSSASSSGEALGSGSSMTIDASFYPKIAVSGACSGTYIIKGKSEVTVCQ